MPVPRAVVIGRNPGVPCGSFAVRDRRGKIGDAQPPMPDHPAASPDTAAAEVFVSYSRRDRVAVLALIEALADAGIRVWRDETQLQPHDAIHEGVAEAIADARVVLAWYSHHYATSEPCQWELIAAWCGHDGARVLLVNAEAGIDHIAHRCLLDRQLARAEDTAGIVDAVRRTLASADGPIGRAPPRPPHHGRQLSGSRQFVGRRTALWALHSGLTAARATMLHGTERALVQLRGFGGVGKSLLAEEYALRFGAAHPDGIFWLSARGHADLGAPDDADAAAHERERQLAALAAEFEPGSAGRPPAEVRAVLARVLTARPRALWIVDDLPSGLSDQELAAWCSPHPAVPTLVTTRDRRHGSRGLAIDLDVMTEAEARALFALHRPADAAEATVLGELLAALGHHPLAIAVAAAWLGDQRSLSIADFLAELRDSAADVMEEAAELADALPLDHSPSIVATLGGSVRRLDAPARSLLALAGCLAAAPIPRELVEDVLVRLGGVGPPRRLRHAAVTQASRQGLCRSEPDPPDAVSVHSLVARTALRHPVAGDVPGATLRAAAVVCLGPRLHGLLSPGEVLRERLWIRHARALVASPAHADEVALLVRVANTDLLLGDLAGGERLSQAAHAACLALPQAPPLVMAMADCGIAMVQLTRGHIATASEALARVLPRFDQALPAGDPYRVGTRLGLALCRAHLGDTDDARRLCDEALAEATEAHGVDHLLSLQARATLAQLLQLQGDADGAAAEQQSVRDVRRRTDSPAALDLLVDEFLLARTRLADGDAGSAAPAIEAAAEAFDRELGPDNLLTLAAQLSLLMVDTARQRPGLRERAAALAPRFAEVLGSGTAIDGVADLVEAQAALAAGDTGALRRWLAPQLRALGKQLGADHPLVLGLRLTMAQMDSMAGDTDAARRALADLLPDTNARLGPGHPCSVDTAHALAECLVEQGDPTAACALWEVAIPARAAVADAAEPRLLSARVAWADALRGLGRLAEAQAQAAEVLPLARARLGPEHPLTVNARLTWALARLARPPAEDSVAAWEAVWDEAKHLLGPQNPQGVFVAAACSFACARLQAPDRAVAICEAALPEAPEPNDEPVRGLVVSLACALHQQGRFTEAADWWRRLLAADRRRLGDADEGVLQTVRSLFVSLWFAGDRAACRQVFAEWFAPFCRRDPATLSALQASIRADLLAHTDWLDLPEA